jgi:hypothetical protein
MAEFMEAFWPTAWILLEIGVQAMHGVRAQEIRPRWVSRTALCPQMVADTGLAVTCLEPGLGRAALGVEPARLGNHFAEHPPVGHLPEVRAAHPPIMNHCST